MDEKTIEQIKCFLKKSLDPAKYHHTIGVAQVCKHLAKVHGVDENKAYLAGLLHDSGRGIPVEKYPAYIRSRGLKVGRYLEIHMKVPFLMHGIVGTDIARKKFHVKDKEILNAIKGHTTGRQGMKKIEKVLYIADMIAPDRRFPWVRQLRALAYKQDLNKTMLFAIACKMKNVLNNRKVIFPETVFLWNELIKENKL